MDKLVEEIYREHQEVCYDNLRGLFNIHECVDFVGLCFCYGTFLGFPYHLIKGRAAASAIAGMPIISRLHGAAMKSSRVGGFCALVGMCAEIPAYPVSKLRGEEILSRPGDIFACTTATGALLQARRGFLPALGSALAVGGFFASAQAFEERYRPKNSEINTYPYSHYRHPQHHHTPSE